VARETGPGAQGPPCGTKRDSTGAAAGAAARASADEHYVNRLTTKDVLHIYHEAGRELRSREPCPSSPTLWCSPAAMQEARRV